MLTAIAITGFVITLLGVGLKVTAGVSAYNAIRQGLSISNMGQYKNFDQPISDMLAQCILVLSRFVDYAQFFIILGAFFCVIFTAFKLWAGTIEVKKAFVDMVYKCTMVTILVIIWPTVINKTYSFATHIGVEAAGGSNLLTQSFASLAGHTKKIVEDGTADYINALKEGALKGDDGTYKISDKALKAFTSAGMTEDEAKSWLQQNGVVVSTDAKPSGWWIFSNAQKKAEDKANKSFKNDNTIIQYDEYGNPIYVDGISKQKYLQQNIAVLRSLSEILTGIPENSLGNVDISKVMSMSETSLNSVFYNPYVQGTDNRISISTMLKTSIILTKALSDGCLAPYQDYTSLDENGKNKAFADELSHQSLPVIMKLIGGIAQFIVYKLGMVICTIFLMLEYSITLIEFLLVGSISTLLIPLFFIDATKQFVSNLIRMILTYFVKLMVTIMMIFFVMGMYLRMAESMYTRVLSDTGSVLYYVFILALGLILAKSSGKVASAVISGNPSLGLGDIAHQMRGMSHAMHSGSRAIEGLGRDIQKAGTAGKKAAHEGAISSAAEQSVLDGQEVAGRSHAAELQAQRSGVNFDHWNSDAGRAELSDLQSRWKSAPQSLSDNEKARMVQGEQAMDLTDERIAARSDKVGRDYAKQARKQFARDRMYNALTGIDRPTDSFGALRVGQTFKDNEGHYRQATLEDVQNAGKLGGESFGKNAAQSKNNIEVEKPIKLNSLGTPLDEPEVGR